MNDDQKRRDRARELRSEMNEAEKTLWFHLRNRRRCRFKFRRQHPIGPYTADFWCAGARVVVELDGISHFERKRQDRRHDEWMTANGIEVLRFKNWQVYEELDGVMMRIEVVCESRIA